MLAGVITVLVVWHSDRLDRRGVREALTFLWQVQDAGGRVESVREGLLDERNLTTIINAHMNNQKSSTCLIRSSWPTTASGRTAPFRGSRRSVMRSPAPDTTSAWSLSRIFAWWWRTSSGG